MELTESEKKGLRRFSLLLESLSDDPWELNLWFDDASLSDSLHHNKYFSSKTVLNNWSKVINDLSLKNLNY